jgi:Tol biopolymer transport system component
MRRHFSWVAAGAVVLVLASSTTTASASVRDCPNITGLLWEHVAADGTVDLMAMTSSGRARQLTHTPPGQGGSELPRWGPGGLVYFDSDRAGLVHVFRMPASGGEAEQITTTSGLELSPAPTADGRWLVLEHAAADGTGDGLFVAPNRPGTAESSWRRLTASPTADDGGFDTNPDVSPDGRTVAFTRVLDATPGSARSAIFTVAMDGSNLRQLTAYSLNATGPRWSPDGRRILFSSNADNFSAMISANVYAVTVSDRRLTRLTSAVAGSQSYTPDWAAGRIVYAHAAPGLPGVQLVLTEPGGGSTTVIYQGSSGSDQDLDWLS